MGPRQAFNQPFGGPAMLALPMHLDSGERQPQQSARNVEHEHSDWPPLRSCLDSAARRRQTFGRLGVIGDYRRGKGWEREPDVRQGSIGGRSASLSCLADLVLPPARTRRVAAEKADVK